jgi:sugar O-acyltransferase (sialic acid O-acetyltransferase NeuD family)
MEPILIAGASGHAKVIIDIIEKEKRHGIAGLLDDQLPPGASFLGYPVLGSERDLQSFADAHGIMAGIVAIGDNWLRSQVVAKILAALPGFRFVTAIHPSAEIARGATIGAGTAVMAGAIVQSDARIGEHCIVNTGASLDHDAVLEDYASLAPRATTGGNARIGAYSAVAIGAVVLHKVTIGEHTVIGAGATVLEDVPAFSVAYGTPARVVRRRQAGEKYL